MKITIYKKEYFYIKFDKIYQKDEIVNFRYSFNQASITDIEKDTCKFNYTPAWIGANNMIVKWKSKDVKNSNATETEGEYIVWKLENVNSGYKFTLNVEYDKNVFKINYFKGAEGALIWLIIFLSIIIYFITSYFRHRGYEEAKYKYIEEEYKDIDENGNICVRKYTVKYLNNAGKQGPKRPNNGFYGKLIH